MRNLPRGRYCEGRRDHGGLFHQKDGGHGRTFPPITKYMSERQADVEHDMWSQGGAVLDRLPSGNVECTTVYLGSPPKNRPLSGPGIPPWSRHNGTLPLPWAMTEVPPASTTIPHWSRPPVYRPPEGDTPPPPSRRERRHHAWILPETWSLINVRITENRS